jgi:hypothetical protein
MLTTVVALPVLVALSSALPAPTAKVPAPAQQNAHKTAQVDVITCPLNGEKIPSCCCPVKK